MSFLSSHRLHWGIHHELTDNFRLQIDHMTRDITGGSTPPSPESRTGGDDQPPRTPVTGPDALDALGP
jgi:hypothetical protein